MTAEADAAAGGSRVEPPKLPLTKRQKRKEKNEKNTWSYVHHPKIQSMEHREKLYVKDAGLKESKAPLQPLDPSRDLMSSQELHFGRLLAAPEPRQRHKAVLKLKAYLQARASGKGLSELDLLKLWKALWYTLYMADKQAVQYELSNQLARLIWCVAGTAEEDEYAAALYLEMTSMEDEDDDDIDEEGDDEFGNDGEDDDDDPHVTLEEIENTLSKGDSSDEDTDDDSNSSSDSKSDASKEDKESDARDETMDQDDETSDVEDEETDPQLTLHCRGAHLASLFLRTFFHTIRRDWDTMDKYRVDKFYTLIRLMMHQVFQYMAERHWNYGIIRLFNDVVFDEVLNQRPNGLRYHLIDLTLDELAQVSAKATLPLTEATFLDILEPYLGMCQSGLDDDTLQSRVLENIIEKFLEKYSIVSENALQREEKEEEEEENDADSTPIFDQVHVGTIAEFLFGVASDPATKDKHRKSLYDMHKKYLRRLKKVGKDVELEPASEDNDEEMDEDDDVQDIDVAPTITPIEEEENNHMEDANSYKMPAAKKRKAESDEVNIADVTETSSKKKRKRKKKKKNADDDASSKENKDVGREKSGKEEEVVITLSEQQKAKMADQKKKKKEKHEMISTQKLSIEEKNTTPTGGSAKKVKFDKVNRSKSHKASMKALVTSVPPKTKDRTPEKGILRNKGKHSPANVLSKSKRKKAVHYF
ncbi:nucleolar protein Nop52 [Nitzschia inconspicua]|uniref:Nucleolar protein Nop52 n=1 Tax=Nitzschia inconspicua TaxID=303405 RepID=A0A9K3PBH9_9STRA|nr:nucleolar protein Nop52 [Nitzschia inconspicua]